MSESSPEQRIDAEWVAISAFRDLLKLATKGDSSKSTYAEALDFGAELYPALLGAESSLLRRASESDTTREYRQRAHLKSQATGTTIQPLELIAPDIAELEQLLAVAKETKEKGRVDQLKNRLKTLKSARDQLDPQAHTETQLIGRDAGAFPGGLPSIGSGRGYRAFELPDGNALRVHLLHPDKAEHISGADVLYERHEPTKEVATLVFVQYKIWEKQTLSLKDSRLQAQLAKLRSLVCDGRFCSHDEELPPYRFPHCAAFLRPTDKLQRPDQKLISSGEHLPICRINQCEKINRFGTPVIDYQGIRSTSVSGTAFEYIFSYGKVGSKPVAYHELEDLYSKLRIAADPNQLVVHAQEFGTVF